MTEKLLTGMLNRKKKKQQQKNKHNLALGSRCICVQNLFCCFRVVAKDVITSAPDIFIYSTPTGGPQDDSDDDSYFSTYAHFSIHEEMLKVTV